MPLSKSKKAEYFTRLERLLATYTKVFVVVVDNVGSNQMQQTRLSMRGTAEVLMGKNTLIRKVIDSYCEKHPNHPSAKLIPLIQGNIGLVFTNADLSKVRDLILKNRVPAPARVGAIAPVDVVVPAGPTGCDPGQTNFFQVLQIPTKIMKGQIEITNPVNLIKIGDKVGASEAALLQKLNINPFSYGLAISNVYDNGSIFSVDILNITEAEILGKFSFALSRVAALSLQIGYPTQASIPHSIGNAFKSCVAVAVQLENYSFPEAAKFKAFLADPSAFAVAAPAAAGAADAGAPKAAAPAAPKEEEVDALEGGMDMFGGGGGGDY
jgi:large subunit ribosomal protein LP0